MDDMAAAAACDCLPRVPAVVLIADGLGSHAEGRAASHFVATAVGQQARNCPDRRLFVEMLEVVNRELWQWSQNLRQKKPMGCTAAGIALLEEDLLLFNVGDVSLFAIGDELVNLAEVHRRPNSPNRVTRSFGGIKDYEPLNPYTRLLDVQPNSRVLICSDGLTDVVSSHNILRCARKQQPLELALDRLFEDSTHRGMPDDTSAVLIEWS